MNNVERDSAIAVSDGDEIVHPASFGIAWEATWIGDDRLLIRGYRARSAVPVIATWDVEALLATLDGALETAAWPEIARRAAHAAVRDLYANDLGPANPK